MNSCNTVIFLATTIICSLSTLNFMGNKSYTVRESSPLELQLCLATNRCVAGKNDQVKTFFAFQDWGLKFEILLVHLHQQLINL